MSRPGSDPAPAQPVPHAPPPATQIERLGIEEIPAAERTATPLDLFRIEFGGANTFATAVLGAFPIIFGLGFWQGFLAILLGVLVGGVLLAPMSLFGPINGTNNAVSSAAHFGVVGRIMGSFLSLLTAVAFFSISVWSAGDVIVGGLKLLTGWSLGSAAYAVAYGFFGLVVLLVCIYGFRLMLMVNRVAVAGATALFALALFALAPRFDASFAGSVAPGQPGFWAAFIGSMMIALSNPISFGAFLGDWTRYIPRQTPRRQLMLAAFGAQVATLLPFTFGLAAASIMANTPKARELLAAVDFSGGLLLISPAWYVPAVIVIALIGGLSTGSTSLYGTGLDFSSVFPRLSRVRATVLVGLVSLALIFIGRFGFSLVGAITTFVTLIIVCTSPWMVIMTLGYLFRKGHYVPDQLQVFNRGQEGGLYWFDRGWNLPATLAWIVAAVAGLLSVNLPGQFVGPLARSLGDVDLSLPISLLSAAVLYPLLLKLRPDPLAAYGPAGYRGPAPRVRPITPVTGRGLEPHAEPRPTAQATEETHV